MRGEKPHVLPGTAAQDRVPPALSSSRKANLPARRSRWRETGDATAVSEAPGRSGKACSPRTAPREPRASSAAEGTSARTLRGARTRGRATRNQPPPASREQG